jgi:hypothetical protein
MTLFCFARGTSTLAPVARARLRAERRVRTPYSRGSVADLPGSTPRRSSKRPEQLGGVCRYIASISAAYVGRIARRLSVDVGVPTGSRSAARSAPGARRYPPCSVLGDCRYACTGRGACGVYARTRKSSASDERDPARIAAEQRRPGANVRALAVGLSALRSGAVSSRAIHDRSIGVVDISASARASLRGSQGPAGLQGPQSPAGVTLRVAVNSGGNWFAATPSTLATKVAPTSTG